MNLMKEKNTFLLDILTTVNQAPYLKYLSTVFDRTVQ